MPFGRETEAAVAARLKAFAADPARLGLSFLAGSEPLPEAGLVLRWAQGKCPAWMSPGDAQPLQRAAATFVRRVCLAEAADHYQVLCAPRDAPPETVKENYHLLMGLLHPDRREVSAERWPEECAQRVNLAYATLGDEAARREYDVRQRLGRSHSHVQAAAAARSARARASEARYAKGMIVVGVVFGSVLLAGLALPDDEWSERTLLEASFARLRENAARITFDRPLEILAGEEARPMVPPPQIEAVPAARAQTVALAAEPAPAPAIAVPPVPPERVSFRMAQAPAGQPLAPAAAKPAAAKPAPTQSAQSPPAPAAPSRQASVLAPTSREIEELVVALIAYYDAGDADRLVGLLDTGFWRTSQARQAYAEFFRSTRSRRLRLENLAWNAQGTSARAKGAAIVTAEYADGSPRVEKRVDVEMDIVVRDGRARLARLSLFPDAQ